MGTDFRVSEQLFVGREALHGKPKKQLQGNLVSDNYIYFISQVPNIQNKGKCTPIRLPTSIHCPVL